jgi:putative transposon-encoded protein
MPATIPGVEKKDVDIALDRKIGSHSNCGAVYIPKDYIGRNAIVVILKEGVELARTKEKR